MSAMLRRLGKCGSLSASHRKKARPVSRHRVSSGLAPSQWYHGTIPLAVVCAIHKVASAGDFGGGRQSGCVFAYAPVTLVAVRPFITAAATRPWSEQSQMGVLPERPW